MAQVGGPEVGELYLDLPLVDGGFRSLGEKDDPLELVRDATIGPAIVIAVKSLAVWFVPVHRESELPAGVGRQ